MKKKSTKILALLLSLVCLFSVFAVPAAAEDEVAEVSAIEKGFFNFTDVLVNGLVSGIASIIPKPQSWINEADYVSENVPVGTEKFLDAPAANAQWSLGYAQNSIIEGQHVIGKNHFVSGGIAISPKHPTQIIDDSKVRVIAMNDGSGRGTVVFAVLDAYGLANNDVREIRARIADFAKANNIVSVNVAVLHQHSAVDTFGMNGDIVEAVFLNPLRNFINGIAGKTIFELHNGKNDDFQNNLFNVTVDTIETAVAQMETGKLYYGEVDVEEYVRDKRPPYALENTLNRFRFVPDDAESKETWFSTSEIHCVGNGVQGTQITADYPYYMEEYVNDNADANFMLLLGAELATSQNHDPFNSETYPEGVEGYMILGEKLGEKLASITEEREIAPLLNITHKEIKLEIENQIMHLAAKAGLFENQAIITADGVKVVSEIGYMEIGTDLAVALVPGELEASIAFGGGLGKDDAWRGEDWKYDSIQTLAGDRELLVFGLCNDQIGYIVPTNDYMPMLWEDSKSIEFVSLGSQTAITYMDELTALIKSK
ncbi:MAG: hypothetical protein E7555_09475 [Ruminococcaceae bacterium]|nr:hypothetical protein [Oscillospiraceae bacterium]